MIHITFEHTPEVIIPQEPVRLENGSFLIGEGIVNNLEKHLHLKLNLDVGVLNESIVSKNRINFLTQFRNPYDDKANAIKVNYKDKIEELLSYIRDNEEFLVHMQPTAESICGLYYLCSLCDTNKIHITYDVDMYELDNKTKIKYAKKWNELVQDNKMLRVIDKGEIKSVEEDYYDDKLKYLLKDKTIKIREFGVILHSYKLPVPWMIYRIRYFIKLGHIVITKNHKIILEKWIKIKVL